MSFSEEWLNSRFRVGLAVPEIKIHFPYFTDPFEFGELTKSYEITYDKVVECVSELSEGGMPHATSVAIPYDDIVWVYDDDESFILDEEKFRDRVKANLPSLVFKSSDVFGNTEEIIKRIDEQYKQKSEDEKEDT